MLWKTGHWSWIKSFAIGSFLERLVVKIENDYLCQKNIEHARQISTKSIDFLWNLARKFGRFLPIVFWRSKPQNFHEIPAKSAVFFRESVFENPAKLDFFPPT